MPRTSFHQTSLTTSHLERMMKLLSKAIVLHSRSMLSVQGCARVEQASTSRPSYSVRSCSDHLGFRLQPCRSSPILKVSRYLLSWRSREDCVWRCPLYRQPAFSKVHVILTQYVSPTETGFAFYSFTSTGIALSRWPWFAWQNSTVSEGWWSQ